LFGKLNRNSAAARLLEEQLYEQVVVELSNGYKRNGLWAKALDNSEGSEEKAKALYIRYRVQSIKDEAEMAEAVAEKKKYERENASVIELESRVNNAKVMLKSKGYRLGSKGSGWIVKEPYGGRQSINDIDELEQYAKSRE